MTNAAAEAETPPVIGPDSLLPTRGPGPSLLDRLIEGTAESAIEKIDTMTRVLDHLRHASIRATFPSDWIIHTSKDAEGKVLRQVGYLQDCGADRAGKVWGIQIEEPKVRREDFTEDKTFAYRLVADAYSKVTGERVENVEGSRWSGDKFFTKGLQEGERVDPTDVSKSAYANLHGRAVRALAGLGGVPVDALTQAGLDLNKMVFVGYDRGKKGGESTGAGVGSTDVTVGFGQSRGKAVAELEDKDITWYLRAYTENVADEGKARFKKQNEQVLAALKAEQERRKKATEHREETGTEGGEKTTTIGPKVRALHDRLSAAVGKGNQRAIAPLLRALTHEFDFVREMLTECTEAELDKLAAIPEAELKTAAAEAVAGLGEGGELPLGGGKGGRR
jgi:hypothetical protein